MAGPEPSPKISPTSWPDDIVAAYVRAGYVALALCRFRSLLQFLARDGRASAMQFALLHHAPCHHDRSLHFNHQP